jgi:predicted CoA-substrate-specific enzyme activase
MMSPGQVGSGQGPQTESLYCGVDVGASTTKIVLLGNNLDPEEKRLSTAEADREEVIARSLLPSGVDYSATARQCLQMVLQEGKVDQDRIRQSVATGYGRHNVDFADTSLTEIHCHGVGSYHYLRRAITVVDIGGQDNKIIRLAGSGERIHFRMNRKCSAGTGAFIEEIALRLGLQVEEMDPLARSTGEAVSLSSFCTVFAKTEVLAHLRRGVPPAQIVRGAFQSVVTRVLEMAPLEGLVVLTGGVVAHNRTIAELLGARLGRAVEVPPYPQFIGALGAALMARKQAGAG